MMKYILITCALAVLLASCKEKESSDEMPVSVSNDSLVTVTQIQKKNAGILSGRVEEKAISKVLKVNGVIDVPPQNMVSISVPMGGYLKSTKLLPGMHVTKGEVIGIVEDQQYIQLQQEYLTAKAKISYFESEYNRQKDLNTTQASSDKVYQQAEADYRSQRILITSLSEKLKLAGINVNKIGETTITRSVNIYSPINGFVSKVNVNIGKYISPTDILFELVNPDDIHLALKVFEKDLDKLFIGQKLAAYTNNQPEKKYVCEILLIGKDLSANGNTEVHCHFETYDKSLIPGTYMNAEINVELNKRFVLPADAIVRFEAKHYVFKEKDNLNYEMKEVLVGETEEGFTEISLLDTRGFSSDHFVRKGAYSLLMMLKNKSE